MSNTAEETLRSTGRVYEDDTVHSTIEEILEVMKEYAEQVARKALEDAAERARSNPFTGMVNKESILSTPIETP